MAGAHVDVEAALEELRARQQWVLLLFDDAADEVGQAAVGEGDVGAALEGDDVGIFVVAAQDAPPPTPPTMTVVCFFIWLSPWSVVSTDGLAFPRRHAVPHGDDIVAARSEQEGRHRTALAAQAYRDVFAGLVEDFVRALAQPGQWQMGRARDVAVLEFFCIADIDRFPLAVQHVPHVVGGISSISGRDIRSRNACSPSTRSSSSSTIFTVALRVPPVTSASSPKASPGPKLLTSFYSSS